jgi:hypothetical protein
MTYAWHGGACVLGWRRFWIGRSGLVGERRRCLAADLVGSLNTHHRNRPSQGAQNQQDSNWIRTAALLESAAGSLSIPVPRNRCPPKRGQVPNLRNIAA